MYDCIINSTSSTYLYIYSETGGYFVVFSVCSIHYFLPVAVSRGRNIFRGCSHSSSDLRNTRKRIRVHSIFDFGRRGPPYNGWQTSGGG